MVNTSETFLVLDAADYSILDRLLRRCEEFKNLQEIDQKIVVWMLVHAPLRLESWIDFLTSDYTNPDFDITCSERLMQCLQFFSTPLLPNQLRILDEEDIVHI